MTTTNHGSEIPSAVDGAAPCLIEFRGKKRYCQTHDVEFAAGTTPPASCAVNRWVVTLRPSSHIETAASMSVAEALRVVEAHVDAMPVAEIVQRLERLDASREAAPTCEHHVGNPMAADLCGSTLPCPHHDPTTAPLASAPERDPAFADAHAVLRSLGYAMLAERLRAALHSEHVTRKTAEDSFVEGFIGWIGSGYNALGRFPRTLTELNDALHEYRALPPDVR